MSRKIRWSRAALDDLKAQIGHIAADDPDAARRVADRILETVAALGVRAIGRPGRVTGTYEKSVVRLPYVVAYAFGVEAGEDVLFVLRVVHTARDWPAGRWPG